MIPYSFSAEEMRDLHNAICQVRGAKNSLEGVLHDSRMTYLNNAIAAFEKVMRPVYDKEEKIEEERSTVIDEWQEKLQITHAVWSMDDVDFARIVRQDKGVLIYDYDERNEILIPENCTLADLWVAADKMIKRYPYTNHVFVEDFKPTESGFELCTGS